MIPLRAGELASLRAAQEASLLDRCQRLIFTPGATDLTGKPKKQYAAGAEYPCGLDESPAREAMGEAQTPILDAVIRLPIAAAFDPADRLRIIERHGAALLIPIDYEIVGVPNRGPSGLMIGARIATIESEIV